MIMALALFASGGCAVRELHADEDMPAPAIISLTVSCSETSKSTAVADENLVRDLNVWVFASSGELAESHYFDGLSIRTSGSVSFDSSVGAHSRLVVIGNAGRELQPPQGWQDRVSVYMDYTPGAAALVLMLGEGKLSMTSTGLSSSITLSRAMSRIALSTELSASLAASGAVLGGNVRIREAKLCNAPASVSFVSEYAWRSLKSFKADALTPFQAGDRLSAADLATLQGGGTVNLYCLPNYTDVPYSDAPVASTQYATYIEMTLDFDSFGSVSAGSELCRFYANDGSTIGLEGGSSYSCRVILSNDGASNTWRKDDFRFDIPSAFTAGEQKTVFLHSQTHAAQDVSFSLSESPGVTSTSIFSIGEKVCGSHLNGVRLTALTAGSGTLYCFDSSGTLMGSVPVSSAFPEISVEDKTLDVLGDVVNLDLQGLSGVYSVRGSDALFNSLYGIVSVEPTAAVSSLYGQDFIYAGTEDKRLYVNKIRWSRAGVARDWTEAVGKSFPYRVTLACGISAEFNVIIDNPVLGPLEGDAYFGEAFDMTGVDDPLPAVASLDTQNSIVASVSSGIPQGFLKSRSEREADGWRTWFGGTRFVEGRIADDYITGYSTTLIRWDLPASAVRSIYGEAVPIFVGKLNPHCNEYVKACVGSYASTYYNPIGVDLYIETLYLSGTTTCLCFRPHSDEVTLDVTDGSFAYQGRDGGPLYSNESGISPNGYAYLSNGTFLETNWDGDLMSNSDFSHGNGPFFGTSLFGYSVVSPYSTATYGAKGRRHLAIYRYSPYRYAGSHAWIADENGRVNCKGYVSVEKWSVSSRAYFDWDPSDFSRPSPSGDL